MVWRLHESFAAGEVSPRTFSIPSGCSKLEEAYLGKLGAAIKRPGTKHFRVFLNNARLIPFIVRAKDNIKDLLVVMEPAVFTVYDAPTLSKIATGSHPYSSMELDDIYSVQSRDTLYLFHPDHEPRTMSAAASSVEIWDTGNTGPQVDLRSKEIELFKGVEVPDDELSTSEPNNDTFLGNTIDLGASAPYFTGADGPAYNVGGVINEDFPIFELAGGFFRTFHFESPTKVRAVEFKLDAQTDRSNEWNGPWVPLPEETSVTVTTTGFVSGTKKAGETLQLLASSSYWTSDMVGDIVDIRANAGFQLRNAYYCFIQKIDSPTLATVINLNLDLPPASYGNTIQRHVLTDRTPDKKAFLIPSGTSGSINVRANEDTFVDSMLAGHGREAGLFFLNGGTFRLDSIGSPRFATATVETDLGTTLGSSNWAIGFSRYTGFPTSGGFHQDRLFVGGCERFPNQLFASRSGSHRNFTTGGQAADGVTIPIAGDSSDGVRWMKSARDLLVGTDVGEYSIEGKPFTPTSLAVVDQTEYGGKAVRPMNVSGFVMYVTRDGREVRSMSYLENQDSFISADVLAIADHIFENTRIVELAYLRSPTKMLVARGENGSIAVYTTHPENRESGLPPVAGWSRWTGLTVTGMAVIPTETHDQLWLMVRRQVNNTLAYTLEYMEPDNPRMDNHSQFVSPGTNVLSGLGHLEAETVQILQDGAYVGTAVVSGGKVTLNEIPGEVTVGLPVEFRLTPTVLNPEDRSGNVSGHFKQVNRVQIRFNDSWGGKIATGEGEQSIEILMSQHVFGGAADRFNGWLEFHCTGQSNREPAVTITHDTPHRYEVVAINQDLEL